MQEFTILTPREILEKTLGDYREKHKLLGNAISELEEYLRIPKGPKQEKEQITEVKSASTKAIPSKFELSKAYLSEVKRCLSIAQLVDLFRRDGYDKNFEGRLNGNLSATLGQKVKAGKLKSYQVGNVGYYGLLEWFDENGLVIEEYKQKNPETRV